MPLLDNPMFVSLLMLLWGLAVRYLPALKDLPNRLIPWMNIAIGIIAKLVAPTEAQAGFFGNLGASLGWLIVPIEGLIARQMFETWVRPTLEHVGVMGYPSEPVRKADLHQGEIAKLKSFIPFLVAASALAASLSSPAVSLAQDPREREESGYSQPADQQRLPWLSRQRINLEVGGGVRYDAARAGVEPIRFGFVRPTYKLTSRLSVQARSSFDFKDNNPPVRTEITGSYRF